MYLWIGCAFLGKGISPGFGEGEECTKEGGHEALISSCNPYG
jgi:hypothetical protein